MKTSVKIILLSLVETIILSAMVCTMIYSINESNHCTYAIFHYDGYATIANDITDFHGEKYPAGTSFRIKRIYENGIFDLTAEDGTDLIYSFSLSDMENSDELSEVLNGLLEQHEADLRKGDILSVVVCVAFFLVSAGILLFINYLVRKNSTSLFIVLLIVVILGAAFAIVYIPSLFASKAPIIYLYPDEETEVNVKLTLDGKLTASYPRYNEDLGWTVTASPDGTLTDANGREYEYLFWEGELAIKPDLTQGFCVKGEDTAEFLEDALSKLGLTDKEADTFIMYWLPQLESNKYNVITFQTEAYEDAASLEITPAPDTVIRVNMLWYPVNSYVDMEPQDLESLNPDTREGFTVVEWGGEKYERGVLGLFVR